MDSRAPNASRTLEAWRQYAELGKLSPELLREHILRAWTRCDAAGASPRTMIAKRLGPDELDALLEHERELVEAAKPYMHALSRAAGDELHAAMLGDAHGVVLDVVGHAEHIGAPGFPGPGSTLSEALAGANGIGSPLAEGDYLEIVGPEHFIEGFHGYTCQGLPLRGADGEQVLGVLSLSVRRIEAAERVREILICAANGIEAELIRRRLEIDLTALLDSAGGLATLHQDILQLQSAARLRLDRAARTASDTRFEDATRLALSGAQLARRFRTQSELWRELALEDVSSPRPLDLQKRLVELVELLATEASMRSVRLEVVAREPLLVVADTRALSRELFRAIMRALGQAATGATLAVRLVPHAHGCALALGEVEVDSIREVA